MKVLVPVDGSKLSEVPLAHAKTLAGDDELLLLRIAPHPDQLDAEGYLEEQRRRLGSAGLGAVRWCLEEGDPVERILTVASERQPDVILMGTHGWPRGTRWGPSVAHRVLQAYDRPLFLCTPQGSRPFLEERPFEELLVPLDGTPGSDAILYWVERLVATCPARVTLLYARTDRTTDRAMAQWIMELRRERLADGGIESRAVVVEGDPAQAILEASEEADLVCMATHARAGLARWWFGSVTERVLAGCIRPLLLLKTD